MPSAFSLKPSKILTKILGTFIYFFNNICSKKQQLFAHNMHLINNIFYLEILPVFNIQQHKKTQ